MGFTQYREATGKDRVRPIKGGHMNIAESIVIITGASSGIGAATARELARRGATVVLAARRVEELNRIANDLTHLGHKALAVPTDVGSRQSIDHLVAQTVEAYGRVDGVINVAGIGGAGIILFPAIADRILGSEQGQARIHISG